MQALGIEVRAGLHTGECEASGDDIGGISVHIGARVSTLAGPNDVLVSSTLRDLVIGSGLEFEERGAHELKGVPGVFRHYSLLDSRILLPPFAMWPAFPTSDYYGGSAPPPTDRPTVRPALHRAGRTGSGRNEVVPVFTR